MSQWTHINASIRFDGIPGLIPLPDEKLLGKIIKFTDKDYTTILPCGSEGSIEYKILKSGTESSLACRVACFYGDLRDYDDEVEILNYFKKITDGFMIRSGVLEIDIEYNYTAIYSYKEGWQLVHKSKI